MNIVSFSNKAKCLVIFYMIINNEKYIFRRYSSFFRSFLVISLLYSRSEQYSSSGCQKMKSSWFNVVSNFLTLVFIDCHLISDICLRDFVRSSSGKEKEIGDRTVRQWMWNNETWFLCMLKRCQISWEIFITRTVITKYITRIGIDQEP